MANGWSCNGTRFRMRWKIDVLFNEAKPRGGGGGGEAELNRTSIFHRMRNIVPLHRSKPLAICVVQHLEYQRNRIRLIRISYRAWVKFHSFSSSWLNIASARSKRNAYFIHKTISVRDTTTQIHTNTQHKVIVTSYSYALLRMVLLHDYRATVRRFCMSSSHRRVRNKLSRCCTIQTNVTVTPLCKSLPYKSHARQVLLNWERHGYLMAVTGSMWLLQVSRAWYEVYVPALFPRKSPCMAHTGTALYEEVTVAYGHGMAWNEQCTVYIINLWCYMIWFVTGLSEDKPWMRDRLQMLDKSYSPYKWITWPLWGLSLQ